MDHDDRGLRMRGWSKIKVEKEAMHLFEGRSEACDGE